ncbi:MAG: DUF4388 domain-containing protein [Nitrospinota bacterium]
MGLSNLQISLDLTDTLQLINQKKLTVCLEVIFEGIAGHLWCEQGEVVHAKVKDVLGERALFACIRWEGSSVIERPYSKPPQKSIDKNLQHLLLDAAQSADHQIRHSVAASDGTNTNDAVLIAKNLWWVGNRSPGSPLQINVFLKKFEGGPAKKPIWLLIDPGSQAHFPDISRRISEITDISSIQLFSVNHQDPDVCSNAIYIVEMNPKAICISTETTSRLLVHYGIKKFWFVEDKKWVLRLITNHTLLFFPTPFCHFAGAFGIYDPETGVVFTGDLFGQTSIHNSDAPLYATEDNWQDLVTFHSIYMPGNSALRYSIKKLKDVCGIPKMIATQHGGIIKGEKMVKDWIDRVEKLPVGIDLLDKKIDDSSAAYQSAAAEVLSSMARIMSDFSIKSLFEQNKDLNNYITLGKQNDIVFKTKPSRAMALLQRYLLLGCSKRDVAAVKAAFIRALKNRQLPMIVVQNQDIGKDMLDESGNDLLESNS